MPPVPFGYALGDGAEYTMTNEIAPPSTLAAQLVQNFGSSTRSSRPDEMSEIKSFVPIIKKVKNRPDLLKTLCQRIEHNHMLIYVVRVVLEGDRWDDPFADWDSLHREALKVIICLKVTIEETPAVLTYVAPAGTFVSRGPEELWLWLFPKLLRILGHPKCLALAPAIQDLFQSILVSACLSGALWDRAEVLNRYLRDIFDEVIRHFKTRPPVTNGSRDAVEIELPPNPIVVGLLDPAAPSPASISYTISTVTHAMHHASSILAILLFPIQSGPRLVRSVPFIWASVPWILRALPAYHAAGEVIHANSIEHGIIATKHVLGLLHSLLGMPQVGHELLDRGHCQLIFTGAKLTKCLLSNSSNSPPPNGDEQVQTVARVMTEAFLVLVRAARNKKGGNICAMFESQIASFLDQIKPENSGPLFGNDFWQTYTILKHTCQMAPFGQYPESLHFSRLESVSFRAKAKNLALDYEITPIEPSLKRRKIVQSGQLRILNKIALPLFRAVGSNGDEINVPNLTNLVLNNFPNIDDEKRCIILNCLGALCCAADGHPCYTPCGQPFPSDNLECPICLPLATVETGKCLHGELKSTIFRIFEAVMALPSFTESRKPRVVAMLVLRKLVRHSESASYSDVEISPLGEWCVKSLQSSVRELRVAASRALSSFIIETPRLEPTVIRNNRENVIRVLRQLCASPVSRCTETYIMAWGQIGRFVPDNELNLVLAQLIDYIAAEHPIVSSLAFNEVLFEPFWGNLAFSVVKNVSENPRVVENVARLLLMNVDKFLLATQKFSLPWLFLTKRVDVITRIVEASGGTVKSITNVFTDTSNLSSILALLLIQEASDIEENVMGILRTISPEFGALDLGDFIRAVPILLPLELFYLAADGDKYRKTQVRTALEFLATKVGAASKSEKKPKHNIIGRHLQHCILGLMTHLAGIINDSYIGTTIHCKRRTLRAMREMVKLCKSYSRIARPHIVTCLLSCLGHPGLHAEAFSCWSALILHMEEEDVEALVETTFFFIIHCWDTFEDQSRKESEKLLVFILEKYECLVQRMIGKFPRLSSIPALADLDAKFDAMRRPLDPLTAFAIFADRIRHENSGVVLLALQELAEYLGENQAFLQLSAIHQQPDEVVGIVTRSLLDCSTRYNERKWTQISRLCNQCLGQVGCIDSNRVEALRQEPEFVVVTNFNDSGETTDFVVFMLENVLVKSFVSTSDPKMLSLLSWVMQDILLKCDFKAAVEAPHSEGAGSILKKWTSMSDTSREILTPFLSSEYILSLFTHPGTTYPLFRTCKTYHLWLLEFIADLLSKPQTPHGAILFQPLQRASRDISVAEFLLPYLVTHVVLGEPEGGSLSSSVTTELQDILAYQPPATASYTEREDMKLFYNAVFRIFDYSMRWLQKRNAFTNQKLPQEWSAVIHHGGKNLEKLLVNLDKAVLSRRAADCGDFPRALFSLELYVAQQEEKHGAPIEGKRPRNQLDYKVPQDVLEALLEVYANIDDPDGLDGISTQFATIDINQQILSHRKAGRWTAAQSWYEIKLAEEPTNLDRQLDLLSCLKESGQYDILLNHVGGMKTTRYTQGSIAPFALEAFWATSRWDALEEFLGSIDQSRRFENFNCGVAEILRRLRTHNQQDFVDGIQLMRDCLSSSMTFSITSSLRSSHDAMLRCHVLTELEMIAGVNFYSRLEPHEIVASLDRRLEVLGAYVGDKQYLLGVRRAAMDIMADKFSKRNISSLWLTSAKLARKSGAIAQAFSAVLHASQLGDGSSTLENARLLWKEGHNRKAIQVLEGAIATNALTIKDLPADSMATASKQPGSMAANIITAKAHLLLAKWLGASGQAHFAAQREKYMTANKIYSTWEKGHYYLGRHYKKLMEAEEALRPEDQSDQYVTGQVARLVIENYVRALGYGSKYMYQTLPRVLTLWLDLGANLGKGRDGRLTSTLELKEKRRRNLDALHAFFDRKISAMPAFVWYAVIFQIVARIAHSNQHVFEKLEAIIVKVIQAYPRHAIWSIFGIMTGRLQEDRKPRADSVLRKLRTEKKTPDGADMKTFLRVAEKLGTQLLLVCHSGEFPTNRNTRANLVRDLTFNHKCTPCPLVIPVETFLSARLPMITESIRGHRPFSSEVVTIHSFKEDVLVLGSLAKPRRLTCVGTDGKAYHLLLKPSDDLRTDQRLLEFNGIVNRALKRDAESSKRQMYVRTYAVTPLNEECGIIEWVDDLRTFRDILLNLYRDRGISINYTVIGNQMKQAMLDTNVWKKDILAKFPPVLPQWFVGQFPSPSLWFAARLRYTRSMAVMSMLGTILGLGDRHGENLLLEEGNGGVFHVDFNCLFDKGLTFACAEKVPFRLTHNMVHAMGVQGYEGAFRSCSELTLSILRQQEETLMSILEAFIYDPTLDLQKDKKKKGSGVKLNPHSVVESIKRKIRGLMPEQTIPLGVEGQVEELIKQAVDPINLAGMYIGWCPFL